jgi:hypothetical protein
MDSSQFASYLSYWRKVQLHSYIRLLNEHRRARAIMESARLPHIALAALSSLTEGPRNLLGKQTPV